MRFLSLVLLVSCSFAARGSADDDYHLEAWITVPRDLRPGIAPA